MHQSGAETLVPEEPYELIAHVRICGGAGRATAGPTRKPTRRSAQLRPVVGQTHHGSGKISAPTMDKLTFFLTLAVAVAGVADFLLGRDGRRRDASPSGGLVGSRRRIAVLWPC